MPHRYLRAVEPLVAHGVREMSVEGASLEHTLREVALMAALVGSGVAPTQAIRQVEAMESGLLRTHPGEAVEPYHTGAYGKGAGMGAYGKGAGMGAYGKDMGTYGKGAGTTPYGKGMGAYGKGATPYGKGMGTYGKGMGTYGKGAGTTPYGAIQPYGVGGTWGGIQQ